VLAQTDDFIAGFAERFLQRVRGEAAEVGELVTVMRIEIGHFQEQPALRSKQLLANLAQHPDGVRQMLEHMHQAHQAKALGAAGNKLREAGQHMQPLHFSQGAVSITGFHTHAFSLEFFLQSLQEETARSTDVQHAR